MIQYCFLINMTDLIHFSGKGLRGIYFLGGMKQAPDEMRAKSTHILKNLKKWFTVLSDMESTIPSFIIASTSRFRFQWLALYLSSSGLWGCPKNLYDLFVGITGRLSGAPYADKFSHNSITKN